MAATRWEAQQDLDRDSDADRNDAWTDGMGPCPAGGPHTYGWHDQNSDGPCAYFTPGWFCDECGERAPEAEF